MDNPDKPVVPRKYRLELQGLRALAALLVVLYHVWLGRVSGGLDVFFLISGFLITGQLYRAKTRGKIEFRPMWGRMIKRLFPAALTVLLGVIVASILLLPEYRWFQTIREVIAAATYTENWRLAADSVNYFAQHNTASLVQHYWSLSIQGQFYVAWPLLIAAVAFLAARTKLSLWWAVFVTMAVAFAGSLAFSIYLTEVDQTLAYFHSVTRIWEFALGGMLALVIDRVALPKAVAIVVGWIGVIGVTICGMVLTVGSQFPGFLALWPTLAAAMVIAAGATGSVFGADRLLSCRPLVYLGNLSFALYLWHWPVLLLYMIARDRTELGLLGGTFVIGLSLALAAATYHLIEEPVRRSSIGTTNRWGAYRFAVITLAVLLAAAGGWQYYGKQQAQQYALAADDPLHPGAQALHNGKLLASPKDVPLAPAFVSLNEDWIGADSSTCRISERNADLMICPTVEPKPVKRIVLIGDSHAEQFLGAVRPYAQKQHWQVFSMLKGGCPFSLSATPPAEPNSCQKWNMDAAAEIVEMKPDAVITVGTENVRPGLTESVPDGYVEAWRQLTAQGIPVIALRDNPRFEKSPVECVQTKGADAAECSTPRDQLYAEHGPVRERSDVPDDVHFLDTANYFCDATTCPPVIGNVIVYMDDNHISGTYMSTMAPGLGAEITEALGWDSP